MTSNKSCGISRPTNTKRRIQYGLGGLMGNMGGTMMSGWGNLNQTRNAMTISGIGTGIAQSLGNKMASDNAPDTRKRMYGNMLGSTAQGAMAGAALGPIGMGVGAAAGLVSGLVKTKHQKQTYQDDLAEQQRGYTLNDDLKSSYNNMTMRNGGKIGINRPKNTIVDNPYKAERDYVKQLKNQPLNSLVGATTDKHATNSKGLYRAGTNVYKPYMNLSKKGIESDYDEMYDYDDTKGYTNDNQRTLRMHGGTINPKPTIYQQGGNVPYEIEGGEAVIGNPEDITMYGDASYNNESELGFMAEGPSHEQQNSVGEYGIPMSANDEAYIASDKLGLDGLPASKSNPSVAKEMEPYLKFASKNKDSNDRYKKETMEAIEDELSALEQQAEEGKFLETLHKMLKDKKNRNYEEIMQFITENNPNEFQSSDPNAELDALQQQGMEQAAMEAQGMEQDAMMQGGAGSENIEGQMMEGEQMLPQEGMDPMMGQDPMMAGGMDPMQQGMSGMGQDPMAAMGGMPQAGMDPNIMGGAQGAMSQDMSAMGDMDPMAGQQIMARNGMRIRRAYGGNVKPYTPNINKRTAYRSNV